MNTKIQPVVVPTKGTAVNITIRVVGYEIGGTFASFYWGAQTESGVIVLDGNLAMESPELDSWGTDDNYVIDWVLEKLNFVKDTTV